MSRSTTVASLNDAFRAALPGPDMFLTAGVHALPEPVVQLVLREVRDFSVFTEDNDPYGEHDFGAIELGRVVVVDGAPTEVAVPKIFWKIDYYDKALTYGSPDPTDPAVTRRVLTIMLADEY